MGPLPAEDKPVPVPLWYGEMDVGERLFRLVVDEIPDFETMVGDWPERDIEGAGQEGVADILLMGFLLFHRLHGLAQLLALDLL